MLSTVWTVILHQKGEFSWKVGVASRDYKKAYHEFSNKYENKDIIALVLGCHTTAHTFPLKDNPDTIFYLMGEDDNEPTRGSD